jgi:transposase InsO family protein
MLTALRDRFEWAGQATDVAAYVRTCDACQRNKPSQQATPGLLMPLSIPESPCQEWTTDMVTGFPRTRRGNDAIQVYVDRLTKVKHFAAIKKTASAGDLAASFVHEVVRPHGVPAAIVSDRDPRFTAHFYAALTKLLGVELKMSTARHPQTDGQSEREIRTLVTALRAFCNERRDDWDDYLDMLELGFNSAAQASTELSPYQMLYGAKPRLPVDVALDPIAARVPAAVERAEAIRRAVELGRSHLQGAQERQERNANQHRREASFAAGDRVLLSTDGLELRNAGDKLSSDSSVPLPSPPS